MEFEELKKLLEEKKLVEVKKVLQEMNEYDIASLLDELPREEIVKVFRLLSKDKATDVFVNLEDETQQGLIVSLTKKEAKEIIEDMYTDDAADLFEEMPAVMVSSLLSNVDSETRNDINRLLRYPENSAGSLMAIEYIHLKKGLTIKQSIERIRKQKDDFVSFDWCFVTDEGRVLLGKVSVKDLLINDPDTLIEDIMEECEHPIRTLMDQEEVAQIFQDYNYSTLPVVDLEDRLVGVITIDDIVDIMEEEATEDMEKMAAIVPTEKPYDKISAFEIFKSRIPWLLLLMVSATFTGKIIQGFEAQLAGLTILTAFIPMLMDTGGNAGSQASVTIIRSLSLNQVDFRDIGKVIWKELRVSIMIGATLAIANFAKLMLIDNMLFHNTAVNVSVAAVICLTIFMIVIVAKFIGCTLPILTKKLGFDPTVMASPFITTIVDALGLLVYFQVASNLLSI